MKKGWLKEAAGTVIGKIDSTKAQLSDAAGKVETVIKMNVVLIVIVVILIVVLFIKKRI